MGAIVSQQQVEDYFSSRVVLETFDDNRDKTVDPGALAICISTAEGLFLGTARGIYQLPLVAPIDPLAVAIVLQLIHCQMIKRFPWLFREQLQICQGAEDLLKKLRAGEIQLDHPLRAEVMAPEAGSEPRRGIHLLEPPGDCE